MSPQFETFRPTFGLDDAPKLLTPQEVADRYRVARRTVERWCRQGRISSVRTPGGHWRIVDDDTLNPEFEREESC